MYQDVVEQIQKTISKSLCQVHTAMPGTIVSFDAGSCTALVTPAGTYTCSNGAKQAYPTISGAPVVFPYSEGAGAGFAFPVKAGDSCIIIFSESELDGWASGAESSASLKFDLSSAMVIPGLLKSGGSAVQEAVNNNAAVLYAGLNKVAVSSGGIEITGDVTVTGTITASGNVAAPNI